jgi:bifunctional N-acetylglucosamine-1-phosphate-uridyltransferase/glucosamine-1-phosphate-acetyltransferase GlmU-like protein
MTWDIVKSLTNNKTIINKTNTRDFNNTQKIANTFNQYFSTVAEKLIKNSSKENCTNCTDPLTYLRQNINQPNSTIRLKNTTTHEIDKIVHSMKTKDSHGYDEISTTLMKMSAPYIVSPLTYITKKYCQQEYSLTD